MRDRLRPGGSHRDALRAVSRIPGGESAKRGVDAFDEAGLQPEAALTMQTQGPPMGGQGKGMPSASINLLFILSL